MRLYYILILILAPLFVNAQTPSNITLIPGESGVQRTFGVRGDIYGITSLTDSTHLVSVAVTDYFQRGYTADSIQVGYYLWDKICSRYEIDSVGTPSVDKRTVNIKVKELSGVTTAPIRGPTAIIEELLYPKLIPGIPSNMQGCIDDYFKEELREDILLLNRYWDSTFTYTPLSTVVYGGDMYKQISVSNSLNEQPDLFPSIWTPVSIENPATAIGEDFRVPFYGADSVLTFNDNFKFQSDSLDITGKLRVSSVTNPYGGDNEIGAVIDSLRLNNIGLAKLSFTNVDVDSTLFLNTSKSFNINLNISDAVDKFLLLPKAINTDSVLIKINSFGTKKVNSKYYIAPSDSLELYYNNKPVSKYYLRTGESVSVESKDNVWQITNNYITIDQINTNTAYSLNEKIGSYVVEGAPPSTVKTNDILSYNQYPFVIPVLQKSPPAKKNLLRASEDMYPNGGAGIWLGAVSVSVTIIQNDAPGLIQYGKNTAERWQKAGSAGRVYGRTNEEPSVGTYTLSGWVKVGPESYNDNISMTWQWTNVPATITQTGPVSITINGSDKEWQYFEASLNVTAAPPGADNRIRINIDSDIGDYVWVERWKLEKSSVASEYDKTGPEAALGPIDTAYAVYYPSNGLLALNDISWDTIPSHRKISLASEFCIETGLCKTIQLTSDIETDSTILIGEGLTLDLNGYSITYNGIDSTLSVIEPVDSDGSSYITSTTVKNGVVTTTTRINSLLYLNEVLYFKLENIILDGADLTNYGINDNTIGLGSIFTDLDRITIEGCNRGMYIQSATYTFLNNFQILRNGYGIYATRGSLSLQNGSFENNDSSYVYWDASANFLMENVYTEDSPLTSPSYRFNFQQGHNVTIRNSSFNGGEGVPDFAVNVANTRRFKIEDSKFNSGSCTEILQTDNNTNWAIVNCNSNVTKLLEHLCFSTDVNHQKGYISNNGSAFCGDRSNHLNTDDSYIHNSKIENTTLQDTVFTQNLILAGSEGNLLKWSDSLPALVATNFTVISNFEDNAELIVQTTGTAGSDTYLPRNTLKPLEGGKIYTISMYVKRFPTSTGAPRFDYQVGSTTAQRGIEFTDTCIGQYTRFYSQVIPDTTTSAINFRFGGGNTGDSLLVDKVMINEGYFPLSHSLGGETFIATNPIITIPATQALIVSGALQANILKDSDGTIGTTGQTPIANADGTFDWFTDHEGAVLNNGGTDTIRALNTTIFVNATAGNTVTLNGSEIAGYADVVLYKTTTGQVTVEAEDAGATPFYIDAGFVSSITLGNVGDAVRLKWTGVYFMVLGREDPYTYQEYQVAKFNGLDTLKADTLLREYFQVTNDMQGRTLTGLEVITPIETTSPLSYALLQYTPSTNSWVQIFTDAIGTGTNSDVTTGLTQQLTQNEIYFIELTSDSGEPNGLKAKFQIE